MSGEVDEGRAIDITSASVFAVAPFRPGQRRIMRQDGRGGAGPFGRVAEWGPTQFVGVNG